VAEPGAEIFRATQWASNAAMILDVHRLGYLRDEDWVLDCTYGVGAFWKLWRPRLLAGTDADPERSKTNESVDFTALPFRTSSFDAVVFDPPYGLRGRGDPVFDRRYGTFSYVPWQRRHEIMREGLGESARVVKPKGVVAMKVQDQVCSGAMRFQTIEMANHAATVGLRLVDRFDLLGHIRPQPPGRRQVHARSNYSTLLVFRKT
jgi:hypothetical protein